ncbi:MAG: gliding motility-associated ABC transporter substrate-binding protein GldG [Crocinitomicaceae bacterium]|nr:gliding motility-associated ABC transporter substrate-binding protein GldG [Crocinitomicaceae bacterium]
MNARRNDLIRLILSLAIVLAIAYICSFFFFKIDLTEEKRHTLTPATKDMLGKLEDKVFVRCYLHGEFPAGFKRLEQSIRERLDEFRDYSNGKIGYEFIDPYESSDEKTIHKNEQALYEKGLRFTRLTYNEGGAENSKLIWPCAIIEYGSKEYPVQFFKSDMPEPSDEMINSSVNNLEYELTSNFNRILKKERSSIGVLEGHGELKDIEMADFLGSLRNSYAINFVQIDEKINSLSEKLPGFTHRKNKFDALIIAKPDSMFSDKDRVLLDQFIMNGGKVMWMVDPVLTDLDSLKAHQQTMAMSNEMGLYQMLFEYGARINRNLVIDFQAAPIGFDTGPQGNQRKYEMKTWYYAPLIFPGDSAHPIVANLDPVKFEFASSIDTVNSNPDIKKFPLLVSSQLSKELMAPIRINTSIVDLGIDYFKNGATPKRIMALLMEGKFPSAFRDQLGSALRSDTSFAYRDQSEPTKMIVIADGDVVRNAVIEGQNGPQPLQLGFDRYAKRVIYDNKEFLLNCMNYLLNDEALISVRSRTIKLRKLDGGVVQANKSRIKTENTALPLVFVVAFGIGQFFVRRRKWAVNPVKKGT